MKLDGYRAIGVQRRNPVVQQVRLLASVLRTLRSAFEVLPTMKVRCTTGLMGLVLLVKVAFAEPLPANRVWYAQVRLQDGRILFVGGGYPQPPFGAVPQAEIYDPKDGKFHLTGALNVPRCNPTATLLSNGEVLIVGGGLCTTLELTTLVEVYNPTTGLFARVGNLKVARNGQHSILLKNGKVLICGGEDNQHRMVAPAEVYNPANGRVEPTGSMVVPRCFASVTQFANGQILFAGGAECNAQHSGALKAAEIYDPVLGEFKRVGDMRFPRLYNSATLLKNGRVLIAGGAVTFGDQDNMSLRSAETYDPLAMTFTATGDMTRARQSHLATLRHDGTVLVQDGQSQPGPDSTQSLPVTDSEVYDPSTGKFTSSPTER